MVRLTVVKAPLTYNTVLGCPSLNLFQAVASTYHLKLKFPTTKDIREVVGNKRAARECYVNTLRKA